MYSVVLMVAATSGGDMSSFGNKGGCTGSCTGTVAVSSCHGSSCCGGGFLGMRSGGGLFSKKSGCHGCSGCYGTVAAGCTGAPVVVAAPPVVTAPPVVVTPVGCTGCTGYTSGCHGSSCHGGGFLGLRSGGGGGLFGKHKGGCCGGCW
jgi:hypothetical protein